MNEDIENWLSDGKDYYSGVMLLRQMGEDTAYFDRYLSASVAPDYQQGRLYEALLAVSDKPQTKTWIPDSSVRNIDILPVPRVHPSLLGKVGEGLQISNLMYNLKHANEPLSIKALRDEASRWHKIEADNHAQMHRVVAELRGINKMEVQLKPLVVDRQKRIAPTLDGIYDKIRTFYQTGEQPTFIQIHGEADPLSKSEKEAVNELWREKLSIEPRLSKVKKQVKYHEEITEKFARLQVIHTALNLDFDKQIADYL
jgi:hypothetical protein